MRQIKFRAWHKLTKKIIIIDAILWSTHGYLAHTFDGFSGSGSLDDIELLQFTGLQDRSGKDIYEGDILGAPGERRTFYQMFYQIVWDDANGAWAGQSPWAGRFLLSEDPIGNCDVVIGNVWENSDLLKEQ